MSPIHHDVLACIEENVATSGASMDQVDERIAAELGVPVDYYFAYLLVWGAIERYRTTVLCQQTLPLSDVADPLQWAQALAEEIGWTASTIYQQTVGEGHSDVNGCAGRVIAAALQLRTCLQQVPAADDQVPVTVDA
jgi:hypothetical protein